MLNTTRMNLFRMFKSKSFYITLVILGAFMFLSTLLVSYDLSDTEARERLEQGLTEQEDDEEEGFHISYKTAEEIQKERDNVTLGLSFSGSALLFEPSLSKLIMEMFRSAIGLLFAGIFAAIFVSAELSTGFLKNTAGSVRRRSQLVWGQLIPLAVFVLAEFIVMVVPLAIGGFLFIGDFVVGSGKEILLFLAVQYLLHFAFVILIQFIVWLFRSKTFSIIAACCLSSGLGMLVVSYLDTLLKKITSSGFQISEYLISSNVQTYSNLSGQAGTIRAILVSFAAIIVYNLFSGLLISKRDIR